MSPALSASPPMTGVQSHSDMVNQAMIQKTSSIIGMEAAFKMMEGMYYTVSLCDITESCLPLDLATAQYFILHTAVVFAKMKFFSISVIVLYAAL